jgi:hypothetical protein
MPDADPAYRSAANLELPSTAMDGRRKRRRPTRRSGGSTALIEIPGEALFLTVEDEGLWSEGEDLPGNWYEPRARESRMKGALPAAPARARLAAPKMG